MGTHPLTIPFTPFWNKLTTLGGQPSAMKDSYDPLLTLNAPTCLWWGGWHSSPGVSVPFCPWSSWACTHSLLAVWQATDTGWVASSGGRTWNSRWTTGSSRFCTQRRSPEGTVRRVNNTDVATFFRLLHTWQVCDMSYLYFRWLRAAESLLHLHLEVVVELAAVQQGEACPCFQTILAAGVHGRVSLLLQGGRSGKHLVQICWAWRNKGLLNLLKQRVNKYDNAHWLTDAKSSYLCKTEGPTWTLLSLYSQTCPLRQLQLFWIQAERTQRK